ncbi:hypothetical protein SAY86_007181 [Trapa natans]|uniref:N-acetyltransferase domain-containing protein n=1 Tax=Trapa natans TaxID=22666 RepID=A0AAN7QXL6_TRANT|nr:hypothetical protein SAY86_007181 [Trapa natans]
MEELESKGTLEKEEGEVIVREYSESKDKELVMELEKRFEFIKRSDGSDMSNSKANSSPKGVSIPTNTISGDPLCRIRPYPLRIMLVAELLHRSGEVVGLVRGCIKNVYLRNNSFTTTPTISGTQRSCVKLGCALGLRVSHTHRRMGIGSKLVKSVEEWMAANGAEYAFLATEETNTAAMNLFTAKCNYKRLSSLVIYMQPITIPPKDQPPHIRIDKLLVDQAISFYEKRLRCKDVYPTDISTILNENLSLGTWVSYFARAGETDDLSFIEEAGPCSWIIFSIWNTAEAYKLQIRKPHEPMIVDSMGGSVQLESFGFVFLYGLLGEGERVGELVESAWEFTARVALDLKEDCRFVMTELGSADPLGRHVPIGPCTTRVDDVWCLKRLVDVCNSGGARDEGSTWEGAADAGNVFVDPRDF